MNVKILSEYGVNEALHGLGLSHGKTSGLPFNDATCIKMLPRADKLAGLGKGHDKFLRMCMVTLDITAPLYWWKEFDTYKVGTVAQSESTMHTLMKNPITPDMFEGDVVGRLACWAYERLRRMGKFDELNTFLPQSFLQRRIVMTNYAALANIIRQRTGHKLKEWAVFNTAVYSGVEFPEWLVERPCRA